MKRALAAGGCGLLFALGLGLGGMTSPAKVAAFLDVAGQWDPALLWVFAGALGTHAALRRWIHARHSRPVLAESFPTYDQTRVDLPLITGAVLFGVGWGLSGFCPGPALVALASGTGTVFLFVAAMAVGMAAHRMWARSRG